ncbi:MAG: hypothetical protein AAGA59_17000 [Actinomycetota bacterium]
MINERERLQLYDRLGELLGPEHAGVLMELLPPTSWDDIATRQQIDGMRQRIDGVEQALGTRIDGVEQRLAALDHRIDVVQGELRAEMADLGAGIKGDMAEIRVDMVRNLRVQVAANFASMLALAGFIVGLT